MTCIQPDTLGQKSQLPVIIMVINSLWEKIYGYESDVAVYLKNLIHLEKYSIEKIKTNLSTLESNQARLLQTAQNVKYVVC